MLAAKRLNRDATADPMPGLDRPLRIDVNPGWRHDLHQRLIHRVGAEREAGPFLPPAPSARCCITAD
jgi:hypothetical protein